jgi:hypothetical protein
LNGSGTKGRRNGCARTVRRKYPKKSADFGMNAKSLASIIVFVKFVELGTLTVGCYSGKVTPVYSVMSYLNSDAASGDVHL